MTIRHLIAAVALASTGLLNAHAATLATDGSWAEFAVNADLASPSGLQWVDPIDFTSVSFDFTVGAGEQAVLTVVDTGFVGDMFNVYNGASLLGSTSSVAVHNYNASELAIADFDTALADNGFSHATYTLGAGSYSISGILTQSVQDLSGPLNATSGGLRVEILAVPEPGALALMFVGLGLLARRRATSV